MNRYIPFLLVLMWAVVTTSDADARIINKGTISAGVSAYNQSSNFENSSDSDQYSISVSGGYFARNNLEVGAGLSYGHYRSDFTTNTRWSLSPGINYHISLDEKSNVFMGARVFVSSSNTNSNTGSDTAERSAGFGIITGWEYFLNPSVALTIALEYDRFSWDLSGHSDSSDKESQFYWPRIGLRIFF